MEKDFTFYVEQGLGVQISLGYFHLEQALILQLALGQSERVLAVCLRDDVRIGLQHLVHGQIVEQPFDWHVRLVELALEHHRRVLEAVLVLQTLYYLYWLLCRKLNVDVFFFV